MDFEQPQSGKGKMPSSLNLRDFAMSVSAPRLRSWVLAGLADFSVSSVATDRTLAIRDLFIVSPFLSAYLSRKRDRTSKADYAIERFLASMGSRMCALVFATTHYDMMLFERQRIAAGEPSLDPSALRRILIEVSAYVMDHSLMLMSEICDGRNVADAVPFGQLSVIRDVWLRHIDDSRELDRARGQISDLGFALPIWESVLSDGLGSIASFIPSEAKRTDVKFVESRLK